MKSIRILSLLILFSLCSIGGKIPEVQARLKNLDVPLSLSRVGYRQFRLNLEASQYTMALDTTALRAGVGIAYGITANWAFHASFPYFQNINGLYSKMGQGDVLLSITYHNPEPFHFHQHLGWRGTVRFPSGFRSEFPGFPSYTSRKVGMENLLLWEFLKNKFTLTLYAGLFSNVEWAEMRSVYGFSTSYDVWRKYLTLAAEFGHEINLGNKQVHYQMFLGMESRLIWGLGFRAGLEQLLEDTRDFPAPYAAFTYQYHPRIPVEIHTKRLRENVLRILEKKNQVPNFTRSPGSSPEDSLTAGLPFIPLNVVVLGFVNSLGNGVEDVLWRTCIDQFDVDSTIQVVSREKVEQALVELGLKNYRILDQDQVQQLGERLNADFVVMGKITGFDTSIGNGPGIPYVVQLPRTRARLKVTTYLVEVREAHVDFKGIIHVEKTRAMDPLFFSPSIHHHGIPLDSVAENRLLSATIYDWAQRALADLFYEVEVKLVMQ